MIYVDIKGNLGNQMFIYACARAIQEVTGQKIQLNTYYLKKRYKAYKYQLNIFLLNENVEVSEQKNFPFYASTSSLFYRIFKKITFNSAAAQKFYFKLFEKFNCITFDGLEEFKIEYNPYKDIYLSGFFQSELFFKDLKSVLIKEFSTNAPINSFCQNALQIIQNRESVCVSVRRGDFVSNEVFRKKHFVCDKAYFDKAILEIKKDVSNPLLCFFSDDPLWIKENCKYDGDTLYEEEGLSLQEKIILMINCKHYILSNSSFSWWMEYLSKNDKKYVIAPSEWYADGTQCNIFRNNWKRIKAR